MNDNASLPEALRLMRELARVLMRSIQAQPGRVSPSDLVAIRRLEAAARRDEVSEDLADGIADTRRALMRLNARGRVRSSDRHRLDVAE